MKKVIALSLLTLLAATGCKKKSESSISAEDIIKDMDSLALNKTGNAPAAGATSEEFDEPEELRKPAKAAPPAAAASSSVTKFSSEYSFVENGRYTLQVNVYSLRRPAERLSEKLTKMGYVSYVAEIESPLPQLSGVQYRVRVGGFATRSEAEKCGQELTEKHSLEYWIDYRKNDNTTENYSTTNSTNSNSYTNDTYTTPAAPAPEPEPAPYIPPATEPEPAPYVPPTADPAPATDPVPVTDSVPSVIEPAPAPAKFEF